MGLKEDAEMLKIQSHMLNKHLTVVATSKLKANTYVRFHCDWFRFKSGLDGRT